jgi:hypothetical protein
MYMYILLDTSGFVNTWMYSHLHFRQLLNGTLALLRTTGLPQTTVLCGFRAVGIRTLSHSRSFSPVS